MTTFPAKPSTLNLARHEGWCLLSAAEAMIKGAMEADSAVGLIAGPRSGGFDLLFETALDDAAAAALLRQHGTRVVSTVDAVRGLTLAWQAARSGRRSVALVPNDELDRAVDALSRIASADLEGSGAACIVLADDPAAAPSSCPRRAAARLNMPCIEPADLGQWRDSIEQALRLSRAGRCPIGVVAHARLLRSMDTLEMRPNRVLDSVDAMIARRRRRRGPRFAETGGALRMARRLELNRAHALPSPGERVSIGFITVGQADAALAHVVHALGLAGRVPILQLGLVHPVDDSSLERLLCRCEQAVVLEARPGSMESAVLAAAEGLRRRGARPALIWGLLVPGLDGAPQTMQRDEALDPSALARRIVHLLHALRPTLQVAGQLVPDVPATAVRLPPRGEEIGLAGETAAVRRILAEIDQSLRDRSLMEERGVPPSALAIDGFEPPGFAGRVVAVELWSRRRFVLDGHAALAQATLDDRPAIVLLAGLGSSDNQEMERLVRGMTPGERAERVRIETGNLADMAALRTLILESALADRVTVILLRDGPPARFDVASMESDLAEIDRLGFQPLQRAVWPTEQACALRSAAEADDEPHAPEVAAVRTSLAVTELPERFAGRMWLRVRPLVAQVEVVRTRPPAAAWHRAESGRLPLPEPVHGRRPQWRAHVAGSRGHAPGVIATVLAEAGRTMGYHVRVLHDPSPIAGGRRAWAQVLFTHPREGEPPLPLCAGIPYGEADLLLGVDPYETLRAIGAGLRVAHADRTCTVTNTTVLGDESTGRGDLRDTMAAALGAESRVDHRRIDEFGAACRAWFHTDRVVETVLLGTAYQMGLVPVSLEAMRSALARMEARGYARSIESMEFGRHLAAEPRLLAAPVTRRVDDIARAMRRIVMGLARERFGGRGRAERLRGLIDRSLEAMSGLAESEDGRVARAEFAQALYRGLIWGGPGLAERFAQLVTNLYRADRGDTGHALTRAAILPLAEVMLIRDPLYVAAMAVSTEELRRIRARLNVRKARGDRMEIRFVTRIELAAFRRHVRLDARTSDWLARAAAAARRVVPQRWRGSARERQLRDAVVDTVERAAAGAATDYHRWRTALERLHAQTIDDRLRGMTLPELRMLTEPEAPAPPPPTAPAAAPLPQAPAPASPAPQPGAAPVEPGSPAIPV